MVDFDALLDESANGCCNNRQWHNTFCQYHQGFREALDEVESLLEKSDIKKSHMKEHIDSLPYHLKH